MTLLTVLLSLVQAAGAAVVVEFEPLEKLAAPGLPFYARAAVVNAGKEPFHLVVDSCRVSDFLAPDNPRVSILPGACPADGPVSIMIQPGRGQEWLLRLKLDADAKLGLLPLRLRFVKGTEQASSGSFGLNVVAPFKGRPVHPRTFRRVLELSPAPNPERAAAPGGPVQSRPSVAASEEALRSSEQHYLSGVIFFQKGDYAKARKEWALSLQLDPANSDARAGLARLDSKAL